MLPALPRHFRHQHLDREHCHIAHVLDVQVSGNECSWAIASPQLQLQLMITLRKKNDMHFVSLERSFMKEQCNPCSWLNVTNQVQVSQEGTRKQLTCTMTAPAPEWS